MLVEFSVTNFRSIRERQTISFVPGSSKAVRHRFSHATSLKQMPFLLKFVGMYGPNNPGKSNVVKALAFYKTFAVDSFKDGQAGESIDRQAFKLDRACLSAPTEMEAIFVKDGILFQYGFSINDDRVLGEWLFATPPGGRLQRWIDRTWDAATNEFDTYVNPSLHGERRVWVESTRPNALLLATAVGLNGTSVGAPYEWIRKSLQVIPEPSELAGDFTAKLCQGPQKTKVLNVLRNCGLDLQDIVVREEEVEYPPIFADEFIAQLRTRASNKFLRVFFVYKDSTTRDVEMALSEESDGTRLLFALVGPLIDITQNGLVLVTDEIHRSMHPVAFRYLMEAFFLSPSSPTKGQLVYTTHETYSLSDQLVHADQIVTVNKEGCSGTNLTPLSDFKIRSGESLRAGYLGGRYGGLPVRRLPLGDAHVE